MLDLGLIALDYDSIHTLAIILTEYGLHNLILTLAG